MKSRSAPIDIAALRKFITLDPKLKDVCTVCRRKMRPPGPNEERTPTCDNCSQDIVLDTLPALLDELEAARRAPKPETRPAPKPAKPPRKAVKAKMVKAQPALKKFKRLELAPRLEPEDHPKRLKPEGLRSLIQKDVKPELEESKPEVEAEEPEPIELEREESEREPEPNREPEREESEPELEIDDTTEVSALALALEEIEPPPPRRRRVQFTPANPKEVQAAVIQLRAKFEK